jgi:endonuclease G
LISEIQIESSSSKKDEFIELYNPNDSDLDLTSWYLQRKTKTGSDFSSLVPKSLLSGKIIQAKSYLLIANASSTFSADVFTNYSISEDNTIFLKNPTKEVADKVGFGQAQDFETAPTQNPPVNKSIGRKWSITTQDYQDTDNNQEDFEIQYRKHYRHLECLQHHFCPLFLFCPLIHYTNNLLH